MMEYVISKTKKNLILFCALFLILKALTLAFAFHAADSAKPDLVLSIIGRFLQIVAYGYILIVLFDYFKHHERKELQIITLSILALEIAGSVIHFLSAIPEINASNQENLVITKLWSLMVFTWIIFLFRSSVPDLPALISIRKHAVSIFAVVILGTIIPVFIDTRQYFELFAAIIIVIPYVFIIEFAMKLKISE